MNLINNAARLTARMNSPVLPDPLLHNTMRTVIAAALSCGFQVFHSLVVFSPAAAKKGSVGKSKEELTLEKRRELERRLQDVSGQLNSVKKPTKPKGELTHPHCRCLTCYNRPSHSNLLFSP